MRQEDLDALGLQSEVVMIGNQRYVVREMEYAADALALEGAKDFALKLMVRCVFNDDGSPRFTDEDLPILMKSSRRKLADLVRAALRVNGFDEKENEKKDDAPA